MNCFGRIASRSLAAAGGSVWSVVNCMPGQTSENGGAHATGAWQPAIVPFVGPAVPLAQLAAGLHPLPALPVLDATSSQHISAGPAPSPFLAATASSKPFSDEWVVPKSGLRSLHAIRKEGTVKFGDRFPGGMPLCGWGAGREGLKEAESALIQYAENRRVGGGGFTLTESSRIEKARPNGKKGARRYMQCNRRGPPPPVNPDAKRSTPSGKCGCPFFMTLEESSVGWVVSHMHDNSAALETFHNHPLITDLAAANAAPGGGLRAIPIDLAVFGEFMAKHDIKTSAIYHALASECIGRGGDVTFTQVDVRKLAQPSSLDRALDTTGLMAMLKKRELTQGLQYYYDVDIREGLTGVFWEVAGGRELWERSRGKVVVLDTKHGTNIYGLKLACLVTMDGNGVTQVIGVSLISHEDTTTFTWVRVFSP
jgi:hypothetical protein